jgi:hypothetical protein
MIPVQYYMLWDHGSETYELKMVIEDDPVMLAPYGCNLSLLKNLVGKNAMQLINILFMALKVYIIYTIMSLQIRKQRVQSANLTSKSLVAYDMHTNRIGKTATQSGKMLIWTRLTPLARLIHI